MKTLVGKSYGPLVVVEHRVDSKEVVVNCSLCGSTTRRSTRALKHRDSSIDDWCCLGFTSSTAHRLWTIYKTNAVKRGLEFKLTAIEFEKLIALNCEHCGAEPSSIVRSRTADSLRYTGIDRIDNTRGYEVGNCSPCCKSCNFAKRELTTVQFKTWIDRLVAFQLAKDASSPAA